MVLGLKQKISMALKRFYITYQRTFYGDPQNYSTNSRIHAIILYYLYKHYYEYNWVEVWDLKEDKPVRILGY